MIITCEAVAKSALARQESRGGHTRIDFPDENKDCRNFNLVIHKNTNGEMEVRKQPRVNPSEELSKIAHATLEELENG